MYGNGGNSNDRRDYSSGGGRGGGSYRGGGGGGYRGGYRGGRGGGGPRGRGRGRGGYRGGHHHHPYRSPASGSANNSTYGNRFQDRPSAAPLDPQQRVVSDLLRMVTQVGALTAPAAAPAPAATSEDASNSNPNNNNNPQPPQPDAAVAAAAVANNNVQLLVNVVCGNNRGLFLRHDLGKCAAAEHYGAVATHLNHCAVTLPLQTPTYAALAVALHEADRAAADAAAADAATAPTTTASGSGFLARTVEYGGRCLSRDLDLFLLLDDGGGTAEDRARTVARLRLQLRFLALLETKWGVFATAMEDPQQQQHNPTSTPSLLQFSSPQQLLVGLVRAAQGAVRRDRKPAAFGLAALVLSTVPYIAVAGNSDNTDANNNNNSSWIERHLLVPLEELLQAHYASAFAPGVGARAVLLKDEQAEDSGGDDDDDDAEEDDDDDDDDEEEAAAQVCDTLQDLLRTVRFYIMENSGQSLSPRLALFADAPWAALTAPTAGGTAEGTEATATSPPPPLRYTGEPLLLKSSAESLRALLRGNDNNNDDNHKTQLTLQDLTGAVYGRLPIFGPPPDLAVDDDDDDEGMDDGGDESDSGSPGTTHERLRAYQKGFGLVDRYFVAEAVRDLLLCHQPSVSEVGVERGSCRTAAEQVWSLRYTVQAAATATTTASGNGDGNDNGPANGTNDDPSKGIEYAILETILSLVVQCSSPAASSSSSAFSLVYLARVVLELTKLEPALLSPAIVLAVSALFQDYLPALTPLARQNLSRWLAFHLIHTDYQWPAGYWKIWEPFAVRGWKNSRGAFVRGTLQAMVENLSNPELLVTECLPKGSLLVDLLVPKDGPQLQDTSALAALQTDIQRRIGSKEEPDTILQYLLSDEVTELYASAVASLADPKWWKTGVVLRALLRPAVVDHERLVSDIEKAKETADENDEMEQDDPPYKEDVLTLVGDAMKEYKPVLLGVMEKEAETQGDAGAFAGEICLLRELESALFYSRSLLSSSIQAMLTDGLLSVEKILQWLLGETGGDDDQATIVLQWWELATSTIHQGMMKAAASFDTSTNDSNEMEGVEEESTNPDSGVAKNTKKIKLLLQFLDPLLSYIVARSGTLLASMNDVTKGNKLLPDQVEIVEGCKTVVANSEAIFFALLSDSASSSQLHEAWVESAVAGPRLASLLDVGGVAAVEMLRTSLERM